MLRVLELGGNWSGPMVGQYLAALGCDVIRLESRAHPDPMRMMPPPRIEGRPVDGAKPGDNPYFAQLNAGKRSVELDLKDPTGRQLGQRLAAACDVVVENLSPGAVERLGLGYPTLAAANPRLCMLSLPALHPQDPMPALRGYAPVFTGLGGLEVLCRDGDEVVGMLAASWGDPNGAAVGLAGLLAALLGRARTGLGAHVIASQVKAVTWQLVRPFARLDRGETTHDGTWGLLDGSWMRLLAAKADEWVAAAGDDAAAARAAASLGLAAVADLEGWAATRPVDVVVEHLSRAGLSAAPVRPVEEAAPSLARSRPLSSVRNHPLLGPIRRYAVPWLVDGAAPDAGGEPPKLGEHTEEVLRELLGMSPPTPG